MRTTRKTRSDELHGEETAAVASNEPATAVEDELDAQPMVSIASGGADINLIDTNELRARQYARVLDQARKIRTSTTIAGGRFFVNGEWVNAFGDLIDPESGVILMRRYQPADGSGRIY